MKVQIRKTKLSDAKEIHELINDKKIINELAGYRYPCPLTKIKRDIIKGINDWKKKKAYAFTILADNEIAGQIILENPGKDKRRYEIGFFVGKKYWNKGIATNAIKEAVKFGFRKLNLHKILGDNDSDNPASGKAMEKAGFKLEGRLKKHRLKGGKFIDVLIWGIIK